MRRVRRAGPPSTDPIMRKSVSLNNVDSEEDLNQRTVLPPTEIVIIREAEKVQGKPSTVSEELPDAALQQQQQQQQQQEQQQDQKPGEDLEGKSKSSIKLKIDTYDRLDKEEAREIPPVTSPGIQPAGEVIDFSTLPRAVVTSSRKRGIVPKMRLMFERARSLEPEAR